MAEELTLTTSSYSILSELQKLRLARQPLTVRLATDQEHSYTSYVVEANSDSLLLDHFTPKSGNQRVIPGKTLYIETNLRGSQYQFQCEHLAYPVDQSGFPCHQLRLPEALRYSEHRTNFRVPVRQDISPPISIITATGSKLSGSLENISLGGACLKHSTFSDIRQTSTSVACEIKFDNKNTLAVDAIICYQTPLKSQSGSRIGIQFQNLHSAIYRELHHQVMKLQRLQIRTGLSIVQALI
ncbi:flagellar brake protein [Porticoccus sp.]